MNATPPPVADTAAMMRTLDVLLLPDAVTEIRALRKRGTRKEVVGGYFDPEHRPQGVEQAAAYNNNGFAIYTPMNPIDPQVLARCANRMEVGLQATADSNILRRRWLLIDTDSIKPEGVGSTKAQLLDTRAVAQTVRTALRARGWPEPVIALSGNGLHALYPIDLPNDDDSLALVKGCLKALADEFNTDTVKVDVSVSNAARITKLYGSISAKGDHLPATPWRLSQLLKVPA